MEYNFCYAFCAFVFILNVFRLLLFITNTTEVVTFYLGNEVLLYVWFYLWIL